MFLKKLRTQMRLIMIIVVVAFLLSTFLMYEGRSRRTPRRNADGTIADYEVAEVNGRPVMRSELERRLRQYVENTRQRNIASVDMPSLYQDVLDQYVLETQMAREVDAQGIRVSDADAENAMKAYADRFFPTREAFYQYLSQIGLKTDDYKRAIAVQIANDRLIQNAIGEIVISDDETVEFYDTMKSLLYSRPDGFMVYLANLESSADAQELHDSIAGGKTWSEAISNDKFAKIEANNLTREPIFLPESALLSGPLMTLLSLDIGEISPIFSISSGDFSLGLKDSRVSESIMPYDDVSGDIKTLLRQQQERLKLQEFQNALMEKAQVTVYDTSLFPQPSSDDNAINDEEEIIIEDENVPEENAPETEATPDEKSEAEPEVEVTEVEETVEPKTDDEQAEATTEAAPAAEPEIEATKAEETVEPKADEQPEAVVEATPTAEVEAEEIKAEDTVEPKADNEQPEATVETAPAAEPETEVTEVEETVEPKADEQPEAIAETAPAAEAETEATKVEETVEPKADEQPEATVEAAPTAEAETEATKVEETVEPKADNEQPEAVVEATPTAEAEAEATKVEETVEPKADNEQPEAVVETKAAETAEIVEKNVEEAAETITGKLQEVKIPEVHNAPKSE